MIFVTVGTHEQQFNRLVKYVDNLKRDNLIKEDVIIQTGFCTYEPKYCKWSKLYSYTQMERNIANARIVITHGGPSSFIMLLRCGRIPIVVPRKADFDEHVNNHQLNFCKEVNKRYRNLIVVEDIEKLESIINNYDSIVASMESKLISNNEKFVVGFEKIVEELFNK